MMVSYYFLFLESLKIVIFKTTAERIQRKKVKDGKQPATDYHDDMAGMSCMHEIISSSFMLFKKDIFA